MIDTLSVTKKFKLMLSSGVNVCVWLFSRVYDFLIGWENYCQIRRSSSLWSVQERLCARLQRWSFFHNDGMVMFFFQGTIVIDGFSMVLPSLDHYHWMFFADQPLKSMVFQWFSQIQVQWWSMVLTLKKTNKLAWLWQTTVHIREDLVDKVDNTDNTISKLEKALGSL